MRTRENWKNFKVILSNELNARLIDNCFIYFVPLYHTGPSNKFVMVIDFAFQNVPISRIILQSGAKSMRLFHIFLLF
jgi:hypothetical protein